MGSTKSFLTAHPRSRGEHAIGYLCEGFGGGSSPLARGTQLERIFDENPSRLIPARAGNTKVLHRAIAAFTAHPRSRGEHSGKLLNSRVFCGSSPLARGTRIGITQSRRHSRLIPARAGNTLPPPARGLAPAAHPRSRGEHLPISTEWIDIFGSSPLARGTRLARRDAPRDRRLIPARAGNTAH